MTPRYHTDPYEAQCMDTVTDVLEMDGYYHLLLSNSLFYPEGGGQPCDLGTIDSIPIRSVYEDESGTWAVTEVLPHVGRPVPCQLDWQRRFDHMQQHSGQHLLSAVMDHLYDNATVGFRLTDDYVTIDLQNRLTDAEIAAAEAEANRLVWSSLPIAASLPDAETLAALPLRKQPKVDEDIRVIEIDRYDYSPCCGTHVRTTGEIGLIKISRFENHKTGVRLEFRCGRRALAHYSFVNDLVHQLGKDLSTPPDGLAAAFRRSLDEKDALKEALDAAHGRLSAAEAGQWLAAAEIHPGGRLILRRDDRPVKELKEIAVIAAQTAGAVIILGSAADGKAQLLLQRNSEAAQPDMKALFSRLAPLINARGGGNSAAAQGGGDLTEALDTCLEEAGRLVRAALQ